MRKFYVNLIYVKNENGGTDKYAALFTNNNWTGEGYCCGWYGTEYYQDTVLIAFYKTKDTGLVDYVPDGDVIVRHTYFKKLKIGSCYWEKIIEAENGKDAIEKFKAFRKSRIRSI